MCVQTMTPHVMVVLIEILCRAVQKGCILLGILFKAARDNHHLLPSPPPPCSPLVSYNHAACSGLISNAGGSHPPRLRAAWLHMCRL
jgi:hypothetical protein